MLYLIGILDNDTTSLERAIGLFERALKLLDAKDNPSSGWTGSSGSATPCRSLGMRVWMPP